MELIRYLQTAGNQRAFLAIPQAQRIFEGHQQGIQWTSLHACSKIPATDQGHKLSRFHPRKNHGLPRQSKILLQRILHQQNESQRYGWLPTNHHLLHLSHGKRWKFASNYQAPSGLPFKVRRVLMVKEDPDESVSCLWVHSLIMEGLINLMQMIIYYLY